MSPLMQVVSYKGTAECCRLLWAQDMGKISATRSVSISVSMHAEVVIAVWRVSVGPVRSFAAGERAPSAEVDRGAHTAGDSSGRGRLLLLVVGGPPDHLGKLTSDAPLQFIAARTRPCALAVPLTF